MEFPYCAVLIGQGRSSFGDEGKKNFSAVVESEDINRQEILQEVRSSSCGSSQGTDVQNM